MTDLENENSETTPEDRELVERFRAEMAELAQTNDACNLRLSANEGWMLLVQLQIAQKSAGNDGVTAAFGRGMIRRLARELAPKGTARHELYQRGGAQ